MNNPIYLTNQELLKGIALMQQNADALEELRSKAHKSVCLNAGDHAVFQAIFLHPNQRTGEIARKMHISKQSLSRRLGPLLNEGLITAHRDPDDQRAKRLSLSTKGEEYYTLQQDKILRAFYQAYQQAGISAVEGFHRVQQALNKALT